jgi:hypothetical protein
MNVILHLLDRVHTVVYNMLWIIFVGIFGLLILTRNLVIDFKNKYISFGDNKNNEYKG